MPLPDEQGGYVPNVIYSCGGMVPNDVLVIPFGITDLETAFTTVPLEDLLERRSG